MIGHNTSIKLLLIAAILFVALCTFTMADDKEAKPATAAVFFAPNAPFVEYTGDEVIYLRVSTTGTGLSFPLVAYTDSIEVILTLPSEMTDSPSASAVKEPYCELLNQGSPVGDTTYVFTPKTINANAKLTLKTTLDDLTTDHLRYFCYHFPNPSSTFKSYTGSDAAIIYTSQSDRSKTQTVTLSTSVREVVNDPYDNNVLVTYTLNTPIITPAVVTDIIDHASGTFGSFGLTLLPHSTRPVDELSASITILISVPIDHDMIVAMLEGEKSFDFKQLFKPSEHKIVGDLSYKMINTPRRCAEDGACGSENCPFCPEQSSCTSHEDCIYYSCIEQVCSFNSAVPITTVLSMTVMMAASLALVLF